MKISYPIYQRDCMSAQKPLVSGTTRRNNIMMKKIIAILSVFAVLFGFTACKNGLEGNLEGNDVSTTEPVAVPTVDLEETELYIDDGNGNMIPVVTNKNFKGEIIYEYTDANGNKVTEKDKNNIVGVTKYSKEEQVQIHLEQVSKQFEQNPDMLVEKTEEIDFVLSDSLVPEDKLTKVTVELGDDGRPVRPDTKSYQDIISGDSFTVKMNIKSIMDGAENNVPLSWTKSGKNLLIETSMPVDGMGSSMRASILYKDGKCYMIMPALKLYTEIPGDSFETLFNPEIFEEELESSLVYDASYELKASGKTYYCDAYKSEDGSITRNYFDDKGNPIRVEIIADNDVTIWELTEVSNKADTSKLRIPVGYFDISAVYGSDFDLGLGL